MVSLNLFMKRFVRKTLLKIMKTYLKTCKFNKDFACMETVHVEIEQTFNEKLLALHPNDPTFETRKYISRIHERI